MQRKPHKKYRAYRPRSGNKFQQIFFYASLEKLLEVKVGNGIPGKAHFRKNCYGNTLLVCLSQPSQNFACVIGRVSDAEARNDCRNPRVSSLFSFFASRHECAGHIFEVRMPNKYHFL